MANTQGGLLLLALRIPQATRTQRPIFIGQNPLTGNHPADITKMLQHRVALEALSKEGQGRWTSYRLPLDSIHKEPNSVHNPEQNDATIDKTLLEIVAQARNNNRLPSHTLLVHTNRPTRKQP
jgi:hypothetical protein